MKGIQVNFDTYDVYLNGSNALVAIFLALCNSSESMIHNEAIASTIGTALGTTQGS